MSEHFTLTAQVRSDLGKGASRRLRRESDEVPAIIYGAHKPVQNISLKHNDIMKALQHESFFASVLALVVNGKKEKAVLKDVQRHPYKPRVLHVDFQRIDENEKLIMHIPLHFLNEEEAVGVKRGGGIVSKQSTDIEIKCLPSALPEYIEIDLLDLDVDQAIHLRQIKLPKGVELAHAIHDDAHDHAVVSIIVPRAVVEEEAPAVTAAEVPSMQKEDGEDKAGDKAKE
jgi:large subunit ribosomal protein L25